MAALGIGSGYYRRSAILMIVIAVLTVLTTSYAFAGNNAGGALIVHTNDAVVYTPSGDFCSTDLNRPGSCQEAITQTNKDEDAPALVWVFAAFPNASTPSVTAVQFNMTHNVPQGNWEMWHACGARMELADPDWPKSGKGVAITFVSPRTDHLFPCYCFAVDGNQGTYLGTTAYDSEGSGHAKFADDGVPPAEDIVNHFGIIRWHALGSNDCP